MRWKRRGVILQPRGQCSWWVSHAQNVTPLILAPRRWRLFFAARDAQPISHIISIDVDPGADMSILDATFDPILHRGPPGAFDSAGLGPSMALKRGDRIDLYYVGAHLRRDVRYGIGLGLASATADGPFDRRVPGPVLSTGPHDPYFVSLLFVTEGDGQLEAWYTSGVGWNADESQELEPTYDLKRAFSSDGIFWQTTATGGLPLRDGAAGLVRPWIANIGGAKTLFFSRRGFREFRKPGGETYSIWSTELDSKGSPKGNGTQITFENPPEPGDWDFEMQAYASVLPFGDGYVMFYNGNGFGFDGFGWATLGL